MVDGGRVFYVCHTSGVSMPIMDGRCIRDLSRACALIPTDEDIDRSHDRSIDPVDLYVMSQSRVAHVCCHL